MFEIELKEHGKARIKFRHYIPSLSVGSPGTDCIITTTNETVISTGHTVLHKSDLHKYHKEKGRKLSLTRAISGLSRAERTKVWAAYFEAKKVKV